MEVVITRRLFSAGLVSALAAPAIVRPGVLMRVKLLPLFVTFPQRFAETRKEYEFVLVSALPQGDWRLLSPDVGYLDPLRWADANAAMVRA